MMTFDEIGSLWCELWQRELERGNEPIAEANEWSSSFWIRRETDTGVVLTYRLGEAYDSPYSILEFEHGELSFELNYYGMDGPPHNEVYHSDQAAPTNPWEEAVTYMRALLEDEAESTQETHHDF